MKKLKPQPILDRLVEYLARQHAKAWSKNHDELKTYDEFIGEAMKDINGWSNYDLLWHVDLMNEHPEIPS